MKKNTKQTKNPHNCDYCAIKQIDENAKIAPNYCGMHDEHWSKKDRIKKCSFYIYKGAG